METDLPRSPEGRRDLRIAADVGGTFTDVAALDPATGRLAFAKVRSTPRHPEDGILAGAARIFADRRFAGETSGGPGAEWAGVAQFVLASTIVVDTIIERTGARTALIVTEGFRDIYEIGRAGRPGGLSLRRPAPLVERALRFEVRERVLADGGVDLPLDESEIAALGKRLDSLGVEAVAILFLNSYRNPAHEARAKALLKANHPHMFVSASHELSREYREFERCSTVAANAYVGPGTGRGLDGIGAHLAGAGFDGPFLVAQANGGLYAAEQAKLQGVRMLGSGPAAGVIGARALCHDLGIDGAIAFDMGGSKARVAFIHKGEPLTAGTMLTGEQALPVQLPALDLVDIGAGGDAIARVDHGALRVGPHRADAGPACYGRGGTAPTVTDANLVLGRLNADRFLGGELPLDEAAARSAIMTGVAAPLGLDLTDAADGIVRVAVAAMATAVRNAAAARGFDAVDFVLIAYGGAGPLHAVEIAREAGIRRVVVPVAPAMFSAAGLLHADLRFDDVHTWPVRLEAASDESFGELARLCDEMEARGRQAIAAAVTPEHVMVSRAADMRHAGQERTVTVDLPGRLFEDGERDTIRRCFDAAHLQRYGIGAPAERVDIVSLRTALTGIVSKPVIADIASGGGAPVKAARTGARQTWFSGHGVVETRVYVRDALLAGNRIKGPALIEEYASTTLLAPGDALEVDRFGHLVIMLGKRKT
jgi:N-methylhydantoinase A